MREDIDAEIADFIRKKGVTRCPTAFAHQTRGTLSPEDQQQLRLRADDQEAMRASRTIRRGRTAQSKSIAVVEAPAPPKCLEPASLQE
jgi:hypothetical protein